MVVDDIPANLDGIRSILHREGYRVVVFRTGEAALRSVAVDPPDLVLLDIMMPGL